MLEWNAYIARTSALRHVFVSVKGFYYQAEVDGCAITWLVPHQLAQVGVCVRGGEGRWKEGSCVRDSLKKGCEDKEGGRPNTVCVGVWRPTQCHH